MTRRWRSRPPASGGGLRRGTRGTLASARRGPGGGRSGRRGSHGEGGSVLAKGLDASSTGGVASSEVGAEVMAEMEEAEFLYDGGRNWKQTEVLSPFPVRVFKSIL